MLYLRRTQADVQPLEGGLDTFLIVGLIFKPMPEAQGVYPGPMFPSQLLASFDTNKLVQPCDLELS